MTTTLPDAETVALEDLRPNLLGPTWERGDDGRFVLPEYTLGWQIAGWVLEYLNNEDGEPWVYTNEQLRFLLWWYAVDESGRFLYRTGVLQRLKGWGKDPFLATICLIELCGPSRFSHWDENGSPVGKPHPVPWVQLAAVAKDQTANTVKCFAYMMSGKFRSEYEIDAGQEYIRALGGKATLEILTSNYRRAEGGRATFVLLNETHHWISSNNGHNMFDTIDGNVTKGKSTYGMNRYLSITNAYLPGEDSVAERQRRAYMDIVEGRAVDTGFLYDSIEADPRTPLSEAALRVVIPTIRGDSHWLDVETIISSIMTTTISPERSRRMWLNQIVASTDSLYKVSDWSALAKGHEGETLSKGDPVVLGFDGGKSDDATALVAIRTTDGFIQPLLIEEKPAVSERGDGWEVDREKVDATVHWAFQYFDVKAMYCDVALWESYLHSWEEQYGKTIACPSKGERGPFTWDMRGAMRKVTLAHESLMRSILDGRLCHGGTWGPNRSLNLALERHVFNARRRDNPIGVSFQKESRESPKKVDAYAALMLAHAAWTDFRQKKTDKPRTGRVWGF